MIRLFFWLMIGCVWGSAWQLPGSVAQAQTSGELVAGAARYPLALPSEHLAHLVQLHERVLSGGVPDGDAAFQELVDRGVKTIISVDGARPDVQTAERFGLRYVHLPHGYDGIPEQRVKELAKAVRDLEGPLYVHCHHGKHRSPAAASVACVTAGLIPPASAIPVLKLAGTSRNYRGLYAAAEQARPLTEAVLDELTVQYRATADVAPLAEAMVGLESTHEHIKQIAAAGWKSPASHPDLDPAHEALLLQEHFTEMLRSKKVQQQPERFQQLLQDSETAARELGAELREWQAAAPQQTPPQSLARHAARISVNCKSCHQEFRDNLAHQPTR